MNNEQIKELPLARETPLVAKEWEAVNRLAEIALELAHHVHWMKTYGDDADTVSEVVNSAARIYELAEECQTIWFRMWGGGEEPEWTEDGEVKCWDRPFQYREFYEQ